MAMNNNLALSFSVKLTICKEAASWVLGFDFAVDAAATEVNVAVDDGDATTAFAGTAFAGTAVMCTLSMRY